MTKNGRDTTFACVKRGKKENGIFSVFFSDSKKKKGNSTRRSSKTLNRPGVAVGILGVTAVLLVLLLYAVSVPEKTEAAVPDVPDTTVSGNQVPNADDAVKDTQPYRPQHTEKTVKTITPAASAANKSATAGRRGEIYFIIDDVGNSMADLDRFLEIPVPITYAVMPGRMYTRQAASAIAEAGRTFIIHQPMEALGGADPGNMAVYSDMDSIEISRIIRQSIAELPGALGMNNHMGSKVTADEKSLSPVLQELKNNKMIFIDSVTSGQSIAEPLSRKIGLAYARRNSMFLDNESDRDKILDNIEAGKAVAERNGYAVMIGHVWSAELADLLLELYPSLIEDGYELKDVRDLIMLGAEQ